MPSLVPGVVKDRLAAADDQPGGMRETTMMVLGIPLLVIAGFAAYTLWRQTAELDSVEQSALAWRDVWLAIWQHVKLTVVAAFVVVLLGVPLGILLTRPGFKRAAPAVVGVANAGQAAPSIGLIVLLAMWLEPGFRTAILALAVYALLPVLRNTITGLQGVEPTLVEAGRGLGLSNFDVLRRIELPLALPVIMSGIRTALVLLVGTAALATFINGGGLGGIITAGITLYRYSVMIAGAVLVALLALLIEWIGRMLELATRPKGI